MRHFLLFYTVLEDFVARRATFRDAHLEKVVCGERSRDQVVDTGMDHGGGRSRSKPRSAEGSTAAQGVRRRLFVWSAEAFTIIGERHMPFVDTRGLKVIERLPGWKGRYFHSANMTFAHYDFTAGSSINEHSHPQEEVYEVIEGELEVTIDGKSQVARPGIVAIVPANTRHSVRALTSGSVIVVDHPARPEFG